LFDQNIGDWDVSYVISMAKMFFNCESFNQNLSGWDVSNVDNYYLFSAYTPQWTLPKPNFTNFEP
jgi:surface protein